MKLAQVNASPASKFRGKKRQREDKDDEEDLESKLDLKQVKKLKQMIVEDSSSDELDVDDSEDDSGEDSDGDEGNDDDDSEHNGDTDEGSPIKVCKSQDKSSCKNQSSKKITAEKSRDLSKPQIQPSTSHVLLFNIPNLNEKELHSFLSKRNIHPESASIISSPVAVLGFPNEKAAKKATTSCSGAAYGQSTLAAITVSGDAVKAVQSDLNLHPSSSSVPLTCVFVALLPKSVTQKEIVQIIGVEPEHLRLITTGPKNKNTNACYIDCRSEEDAKNSFRAIQNHLFDGNHVKVYLKPKIKFNPVTECSFVAANVPFSAGIDDMKKEFPSAKKIETTRKGCFMLTFDSVEIRSQALKESEGKVMDGRILRFITTEVSPIASLQNQEKKENQKHILKKESAQADEESNSDEEEENNSVHESDEEVDEDEVDDSNEDDNDADDKDDSGEDSENNDDEGDSGSDEDEDESLSKRPKQSQNNLTKQQNKSAKFDRGGSGGGFQHRGGRGGFQHRGGRGDGGGFQHRGGRGGFQHRGGSGGFQNRGGRGGGGFRPRGGRGGRGRSPFKR